MNDIWSNCRGRIIRRTIVVCKVCLPFGVFYDKFTKRYNVIVDDLFT